MILRPLRRRALVLLVGVLAVVAASLPTPATADSSARPVVVIGAAGLSWEDIDPQATPALWSLAQDGVGSLVVRSVRRSTCPIDGWLGLNTGERAADVSSRCRGLTEPVDGRISDWPEIAGAVADQKFSATLGTFAGLLEEAGVRTTSIGPGAAVALADADGTIEGHVDRVAAGFGLTAQVSAAAAAADLLVVDAGSIRPATEATYGGAEQHHADQVRTLNRRVAAILDGLTAAGTDPVIVLAGLADTDEPGLRTLAISGPGWSTGELVTSSTRQDGYVLATDLQATLFDLLGVRDALPSSSVHGSPATLVPTDEPPADLVAAAIDRNLHAQAASPLTSTFFLVMVVINLALYAIVALGLKRPTIARITKWWRQRFSRHHDHPAGPGGAAPTAESPAATPAESAPTMPDAADDWLPPRTWVLRVLRGAAISIGALPVASFLADLIPWWRASAPGLALAAATLAWMALLAAVALSGPWRRHVLGGATVIAAVTAAVLAIDIYFGAGLQIGAIMGSPALVAGRFYGMNNTAFALFTASILIVTISLAQPFVRRGRRWSAVAVIILVGMFATVIDGAPGLGADFGGPPALLPAFAIMVLLTLEVRLTWKRVLAVLVGAGLATLAIAFVDWLRPVSDRTHLGAFFETLLSGEVFPVIWRKLDQNLTILFGNRPLTLLAICGVLTVVFVLARPIRGAIIDPHGGRFSWLSQGTPISRMSERTPLLRAGVIASGVAAAIGMAVNDSGVSIPANMVAITVPLLLAACATWMLTLESPQGRAPAPDEPSLSRPERGRP